MLDGSRKLIRTLSSDRLRVAGSATEIANLDVLLVTVKTYHLEGCAPMIVDLMNRFPNAVVVPVLNGVSATTTLQQAALAANVARGQERVLYGISKCVAYVPEPGSVIVELEIGLNIGRSTENPPVPLLATVSGFADLCNASSLACGVAETVEEMRAMQWRKLLITGVLGPVSAAVRAPVDVIASMPELREMATAAMAEAVSVGRALGVDLPDEAIDTAMAVAEESVPGTTFSITRDMLAGRESELDAFSGEIVRLGETAGVATPVTRHLLHTLLPQERKARGELVYTLRGIDSD